MTFTIEPILTLGTDREVYWPDDWTNVTVDGKRTAQFGTYRFLDYVYAPQVLIWIFIEHTMLVTETGVEVLTARLESSPGGPIPIPGATNGDANKH
jgi:methionyl aminopeptidase